MRTSAIAKAWRIEIGLERPSISKAKLRAMGKQAKAEWDAQHGRG